MTNIRPLTDAEIIATAKAQGLGVVDKEEPSPTETLGTPVYGVSHVSKEPRPVYGVGGERI